MRKFTITIEAKTEEDADYILSRIRDAILEGYTMAPWSPDGEGSGYNFSSEGYFDDDPFIQARRSTSNSRRRTNRPKAENMLLDRIVAKICKPISPRPSTNARA